jgi:hypothetical protein
MWMFFIKTFNQASIGVLLVNQRYQTTIVSTVS